MLSFLPSHRFGASALVLATCALLACGGDGTAGFGGNDAGGSGATAAGGGDTGGSDAGGGGADGSGAGAGGTGGMGGAGGGGGGAPACDRNGIAFATEDAATFGGLDGTLVYNGFSMPSDSGDLLVVELWFKYGATSVPHSFTFTGENYVDCHTCATLQTACDGGDCARRFLVESGTLDVTTIDTTNGTFAGTLQDVTAVEVTIDPSTAVSTPVPDGETWCVESVAFSASITALPSSVTKP